jgi:hypothetical protein
VEIVRRGRVVRDEETGAFFVLPVEGEPLELGDAIDAAAREMHAETGRVPGRDAVTAARRVLADPDAPRERIAAAIAPELDPEERARLEAELLEECGELAREEELLVRLRRELLAGGYVGETSVPELIYLAVGGTTLLDAATCKQPVSVGISGASSSGKNFAADSALALLPPELAYLTSGMSPKAVVYDPRDLRRAYLYVPEGAALATDSEAALMIRTLISEGRLVWAVVVTRENAPPVTHIIEREGPTGLLLTSSAIRLDRDLANRMLRLHVPDDPALTTAIIRRIGASFETGGVPPADHSAWHALYRWHRLGGPFRVRIPFSGRVSAAIPPAAVRLRRDTTVLWSLVAAHAALHRLNRATDDEGRIIAEPRDYEALRDLLEPVLAASAGTSVPAWAAETWEVLPVDYGENPGISYSKLGERLEIGRDAARDRALRMLELGAAVNLASKGRPARLVRGDEPASSRLLPQLAELDADEELLSILEHELGAEVVDG